MASVVYLALGSNLGRRQDNLQGALNALGEFAAVEALSPIFETAPWGIADQPDYLNACLAIRTALGPHELLARCKAIEQRLGREPGPRWGPRLIDIDILDYSDREVSADNLIVPHPRLSDRPFVLAPLATIAPDFVYRPTQTPIAELLANVDLGTINRLSRAEGALRRPVLPAWGVKTYVMGILNVTPDSFSGDGLLQRDEWLAAVVAQATAFVEAGADILDLGGESTRPGSRPITADEELDRVVPAVQAVRREVDVPLSVDTYRAAVARAALEAGADWINDVWGLRMDPALAGLAAERGCPVVLMHNRSKPKDVAQEEWLGGRYVGIHYDDLIPDVIRELRASVDLALAAGVRPERIIVDPGIGFGKSVSQNLRLLNELDAFRAMGYPLLVGPSRKSFIGYTLNLPPGERLDGTAAAVAVAIDRGADVVRVHDVAPLVRVARMTDAIIGR